MKSALRTHVAALLLIAPIAALVSAPAAAQNAVVVTQAAIHTILLDADHGLSPGSALRLRVQATPGARAASVTLGSSGVVVPLREQAAGLYAGSHVIRRVDRIDPTQVMTARATYGNRTIAMNFTYPPAFQALAMGAPAVAIAPQIERFVMRPLGGRVEPGQELRFRLVGVPGSQVTVEIPGVARGIALAETRPGVYEGHYTIRRRDDPDAFPNAVATLQSGGLRATAVVQVRGGDVPQARDDIAPQITDVFPGNGDRVDERGRVEVTARVRDEGSGLDPASVRLRVDGRDVTDEVRVNGDEIRYRENLAAGRHEAELVVRDRAGNTTRRLWSFNVVGRGYGSGYGR